MDNALPGMRRLLAYYPNAAPPLIGLMEVMMRGEVGLSAGERELIAAFVSKLNNCPACENIHSEVARHLCNLNEREIQLIKINYKSAEISNRLKTLLSIAEQTKRGGKHVTAQIDIYPCGLFTNANRKCSGRLSEWRREHNRNANQCQNPACNDKLLL